MPETNSLKETAVKIATTEFERIRDEEDPRLSQMSFVSADPADDGSETWIVKFQKKQQAPSQSEFWITVDPAAKRVTQTNFYGGA